MTTTYILEKHEVEPVIKTVQMLYEFQKMRGFKEREVTDAIGVLEDLLDDARRMGVK